MIKRFPDEDEVAALAANAGLADASIVLASLDTPHRLAINPTVHYYPASMIKTPLAVATAVAAAAGRIDWDEPVIVEPEDMTVNDAPSPLVAGYTSTPAELLDLMIEKSDNVATNVLLELVGREHATADIVALGFPGTAFRRKLSGALPLIDDPRATGRNEHPAGEVAELFERIAFGTVPEAARIERALAAQVWNTKLSVGLGAGDHFAHKTGDTDDASHDGGILTLASGRRYVLVVFTGLPTSDETDARFAAFMRALHPLL